MQALINKQFENASNVYTIQKLNNSTGLYENIIVRLDVPYELKQVSTKADDFRQVIFKDDAVPILIGDMYNFNGSYWICIDDDRIETPSNSCIIQRCTHAISLYKNNILYEIPCIVESTVQLYRMQLEDNKYLSELSDNIVVRVPNTETTSLMQVNDKYEIGRFTYKVTNLSDIIYVGLLVLKLEIVQEQQIIPIFELSILNGSSIQVNQNDSLTINSQVTDTTTNTIITPTPSITYTSSNPLIATINVSTGVVNLLSVGSVVFTAKLTSDLTVLDTISVEIVSIAVSNYVVSPIDGDSDIVLGYESILTAKILDNGIWNQAKGVNWTITNQDSSSNSYVTIISQNSSSITLKASSNTAYKNKIVVVKATFTENALVYSEREIKLITLF